MRHKWGSACVEYTKRMVPDAMYYAAEEKDIEERTRANQFLVILMDHLSAVMKCLYSDGGGLLQDDSAPMGPSRMKMMKIVI